LTVRVDEASLTRADGTLGAVTSAIVVGEIVLATVVATVVGTVVGAAVVGSVFAVVVARRDDVAVRRAVVAVRRAVVTGAGVVGAATVVPETVGTVVCAVAIVDDELATTNTRAPSAMRR
jgi:hypothetical protein